MENILALARSTQTSVLCTAWGLSANSVRARKEGKRPMSFHEALALCRVHGIKLSSLLHPGFDPFH